MCISVAFICSFCAHASCLFVQARRVPCMAIMLRTSACTCASCKDRITDNATILMYMTHALLRFLWRGLYMHVQGLVLLTTYAIMTRSTLWFVPHAARNTYVRNVPYGIGLVPFRVHTTFDSFVRSTYGMWFVHLVRFLFVTSGMYFCLFSSSWLITMLLVAILVIFIHDAFDAVESRSTLISLTAISHDLSILGKDMSCTCTYADRNWILCKAPLSFR